ncbi:unnamed protein product [Rotaria sp. Silwood2]|nr:unnamed protein product [Rotaria sp. Silwood2]CAF3220122.1 unnamed protein product [Rotaria sp. Silwood2]CAF3534761.1 unnamed protein product [Rotaria sp. Silwood2]CAF4604477.1 unnamed protein product [Rotaria sp. Silwood2]CAF4664725.1 unnamed protein product [Rotaria sp. Silwood2]
MSLQQVVVIWLDVSSSSSDEIDSVICKETKEDLVTNGAPVITVATSDEAIQQIIKHPTAKIFFISSGRLGKDMVPIIVGQYPLIHSFYIFCFAMAEHVKWASDYINCL